MGSDRDYPTGAQFTVYTDNNPVAHLQTAHLGAVELRWVAQLASFNCDIKYRSGKSNVNADSLSRFPVEAPDTEHSGVVAFSAAVELAPGGGGEEWADSEWEEAQASDPDVQTVKRYVETRVKPSGPERRAMSRRAQKMLQQWK